MDERRDDISKSHGSVGKSISLKDLREEDWNGRQWFQLIRRQRTTFVANLDSLLIIMKCIS